ncbi:uncharacterized protein LACBIDRAFT_306615 [Laccaria bicolor S238N-H82]|uniref:Predicted protein n=1 Tax=Laccaria bicolor (strain S238N-H82 / ATCC MYA-4686) TaxID=486041 RepID=B0DNF5_LACBS|nr:uncharacterized protein LACBIDRAFT_306615 [Laccaria bicolor S238N-H82]EDR03928.1 predicted protein [Laccaria bicolor S238N-H82]|eukprot:XP_001885496.1 predicted protein [Laccaria bicolor S238N-H82]
MGTEQSSLPPGAVPFFIMVYADKNRLSSFGTAKGYPAIAVCAHLRGLISAPLIPAGFRSFLRIPVDSGGMKFSREACYFLHSGALPFQRNFGIPEL